MQKIKLAIITSHPIQYHAPLFQQLQERGNIAPKVFYTWGKTALENKFDPGFGKVVQWDIPLLEGYDYEFLENSAADKGSHHFMGINNPDIISRIDAYMPDAILVYGWAFKSHLKVLRHYAGRKLILFRGDSTLLNSSSWLKEEVRSLFLRWVYSHVDFALYVGQNNYAYYKRSGLKERQLLRTPHAINNVRFSDQSETMERESLEIRESLGIHSEEVVFLYAGKLEEVKDVQLLMHAFKKSGLQGTSHLVILGNGNLEKMLKEEFQRESSIHFMNFQNQARMPVIYRLGDVFVLPSKSETWGLSVNEAMACARPVLVSDRCGCAPDLVLNGKNGYVFKSGDLKDLIDKLLLLGLNKQVLKDMGKFSLEHIQNFSYQYICEVIENTLSSSKNHLCV